MERAGPMGASENFQLAMGVSSSFKVGTHIPGATAILSSTSSRFHPFSGLSTILSRDGINNSPSPTNSASRYKDSGRGFRVGASPPAITTGSRNERLDAFNGIPDAIRNSRTAG